LTSRPYGIERKSLEPELTDDIEKLVENGADRELCGINALAFAARHKFARTIALIRGGGAQKLRRKRR
jgi:hypothetical protein